MQDLNLRAGRSQEVTLVHVPPPYTCISLRDKLFPHLRALSSHPLQCPSNVNYLRLSFLVIYIHSRPLWGPNRLVGVTNPTPLPQPLIYPLAQEARPAAAWITRPSNQHRALLLLVVPPSNRELAPSSWGSPLPPNA